MPNEIKRDLYLKRLVERRENGMIKVITGIRRCGKSYLLFELFYRHLIESGVSASRIIRVALDSEDFAELRDAHSLNAYITRRLTDEGTWFVLLDEVQFCPRFESVLNSLNRRRNVDIYVSGSNSKFLSSDILTEFRGRGDEVRVRPLSFAEFFAARSGDKYDAWSEYCLYGGLPQVLSKSGDELKAEYLSTLCRELYLKDLENRHNLRTDTILPTLLNILASAVGSLTNPSKLANAFKSAGISVTDKTLSAYIEYLTDAFLINRSQRFDIKGKKYIASPYKYFFTDIGLRNAFLNFRQQEENHIMENILYNELLTRGFCVDVGIVEYTERNSAGNAARKRAEVDFVCNRGNRRYYVQSAFAIPDAEKMAQEQNSLVRISDSFKKILVVKNRTKLWRNEQGIVIMDIWDFLLREDSLDL